MSKRKASALQEGHHSLFNPVAERANQTRSQTRSMNNTVFNHVEDLLVQHARSLIQPLKIARGIERQKLGRRVKTAIAEERNEEDAESARKKRQRLNAEIEVLKSLDFELTAQLHLLKSLLKVKGVVGSPGFPKEEIESKTEMLVRKRAWNAETGNVLGRLFKTSEVGKAVESFIQRVRVLVGEYQGKGGLDDVLDRDVEEEEEFNGFESLDEGRDHEDSTMKAVESEASEGELYERYAPRLASSSDDEDSLSGRAGDQMEMESSTTGTGSPESDLAPPITTTSKRKPSTQPVSTTFLPSLAVAGYYSGDESASSDYSDGEKTKRSQPQPRRNRMGQQARRALWEKKYGMNANHIAHAERNGAGHAKRSDGVRDRRTGSKSHIRNSWQDNKGDKGRPTPVESDNRSKNAQRGKPKAGGGQEELHPSWEAAKKAKESRKTLEFTGTKVVF